MYLAHMEVPLTLSGLSSEINVRPGGGGNIAPLGFVLF